MLVLDEKSPSYAPKASVFLHGVTGAGKSTWATASGRPLVILTEPKAMSVLRQVNPNAIGLVPESTKDILDLFVRLGQPDWLESKKIDRIVLDSFTDLTYTLPSWMKDGSGILLKMEISEFGDLKSYALALVKAIQLTGFPSIIIARSTVKRVGRVDKIVPDGYGKSVEELPGKCLPTIEARFDQELGYVMDSSPDECSQRCGLPWVPPVFNGTALEFLGLVGRQEAVQQDAAKVPAPVPAVPADAPTCATPGAFSQMTSEMLAEKEISKAAVSAEADAFVDGMADGPSAVPAPLAAGPDGVAQVLMLAQQHKVNPDQLLAYAQKKAWVTAEGWTTLTADGGKTLVTFLENSTKRQGLQAHLAQHYPLNQTAA
jgi:hypothetical protein